MLCILLCSKIGWCNTTLCYLDPFAVNSACVITTYSVKLYTEIHKIASGRGQKNNIIKKLVRVYLVCTNRKIQTQSQIKQSFSQIEIGKTNKFHDKLEVYVIWELNFRLLLYERVKD